MRQNRDIIAAVFCPAPFDNKCVHGIIGLVPIGTNLKIT